MVNIWGEILIGGLKTVAVFFAIPPAFPYLCTQFKKRVKQGPGCLSKTKDSRKHYNYFNLQLW